MKKHLFILTLAVMALSAMSCTGGKTSENVVADESTSPNAVIDCIMARRSVRHYTDQPVSRELLQQLAVCGVNAPNGMNRQDWAIRIVDSKEYLDGVTELMKNSMPFFANSDDPKFRNAFRNATAVVFVGAPADEIGMSGINVGALCENICLAAQSMGLGSVIMAGPSMFISTTPEAKPYLDRLNLPEGYKLSICIGLGYPDEAPDAKPRDLNKIQFVD